MDTIWAEIPTGYFPLPIDDIEESMARAEEVLTGLAPDELRSAVASVVSTQILAGAIPAALMALAADAGLGWVEKRFAV